MYRNLRDNFTERNNKLVRDIDTDVEKDVLEQRFLSLLSDLQSVPVQSMFSELELGVLSNLQAVHWLRDLEESGEIASSAVRSLVRLLSAGDRESLSEDVEYNVLMNSILEEKVCQRLPVSSHGDLLEIVSFLILNKSIDHKLIGDYCLWFEKMKICQEDLNLLTTNNVYQREIMKVVSLTDGNSVPFSEVLRRIIKIKTNFGPVEIKEMDQISVLLEAAMFYKQGNRDKLFQCLNRILERDRITEQSEMITKYFLILKGNILIEENKYHSAIATFSTVITEDPGNIEAYAGVANCFQKMGKLRNELDIWRIISHIHHHKNSERRRDSFDLRTKLLRSFFPLQRRSFVSSLLVFARKCLDLGEFEDAADSYLDILSLDLSHQDGEEDKIVVQQETVLALQLDKRWEASIALLQHISNRRQHSGLRKRRREEENEDSLRTVVTYFLFGQLYRMTGQHQFALRSYSTSIQICQSLAEHLQLSHKRIKLESQSMEDSSSSEDLNIVQRMRARLYAEKSLTYRNIGDKLSSIVAIKSALRMCYSQVYHNIYCEYLNRITTEDEERQFGEKGRVMDGERYNEDVCISFMITTTTIKCSTEK